MGRLCSCSCCIFALICIRKSLQVFPDVTSLRPTGGLYIFGDQRFISFQRGQLNWVNSYYLWEHIQQADLILKIAIMADHITRIVRYGRNQPT